MDGVFFFLTKRYIVYPETLVCNCHKTILLFWVLPFFELALLLCLWMKTTHSLVTIFFGSPAAAAVQPAL